MTAITNELIYEILKKLQADIAEVKTTLADHTRHFLRVREDINSLRDDITICAATMFGTKPCRSRSVPALSASKHGLTSPTLSHHTIARKRCKR
jgi:hypothetical protein